MQLVLRERRPRPSHLTVLELRELESINDPYVNLVLWPRPTLPWMQLLGCVTSSRHEARKCVTTPSTPLDDLVAPLVRSLDRLHACLLLEDISRLMHVLFTATSPGHVEASLATVHDDACRKFHVDRRSARLLCTYAGPGTEWLPNRAVDRAALASDDLDFERANCAIARDPRERRSVPSPWVALLKGEDAQMRGYPVKPRALAWDARSELLATSGDTTVTVWRFGGRGPEGTRPIQLVGHEAACSALAFSPRKGVLASGAQDTGIILWEPKAGSKPCAFGFMDDFVVNLAWHPRHESLIATDAAGNATIFGPSP